jgi:hypothetical protein
VFDIPLLDEVSPLVVAALPPLPVALPPPHAEAATTKGIERARERAARSMTACYQTRNA